MYTVHFTLHLVCYSWSYWNTKSSWVPNFSASWTSGCSMNSGSDWFQKMSFFSSGWISFSSTIVMHTLKCRLRSSFSSKSWKVGLKKQKHVCESWANQCDPGSDEYWWVARTQTCKQCLITLHTHTEEELPWFPLNVFLVNESHSNSLLNTLTYLFVKIIF